MDCLDVSSEMIGLVMISSFPLDFQSCLVGRCLNPQTSPEAKGL